MGNHYRNVAQLDDLDESKTCTVCHRDHIYSSDNGHFCTDCNMIVVVVNKSELAGLVISENTTSRQHAVCAH